VRPDRSNFIVKTRNVCLSFWYMLRAVLRERPSPRSNDSKSPSGNADFGAWIRTFPRPGKKQSGGRRLTDDQPIDLTGAAGRRRDR